MALLTGCDGWRRPSRAGEIKLFGAASLTISHRGNDLCPGCGGGGGSVCDCLLEEGHDTAPPENAIYVNK